MTIFRTGMNDPMKNEYDQIKLLKVHPTPEERITTLTWAVWLLSAAVVSLLVILVVAIVALK